jgi:hypothetical protein
MKIIKLISNKSKLPEVTQNKKRNSKKQIPLQQVNLLEKIRVRLDYKTVVIINRVSSFDVWKKLYPGAEIIS